MTVGNQLFNFIVNTGSSAAWVASPGYQCVNSSALPKQQAIDQSSCGFGNLYNPNETFQIIPGKHQTNIYEAGCIFVSGPLGRDTFSLSGASFPNQEFCAAILASFAPPDNFTSGLFGWSILPEHWYATAAGALWMIYHQTPPPMHHSSRQSRTLV